MHYAFGIVDASDCVEKDNTKIRNHPLIVVNTS